MCSNLIERTEFWSIVAVTIGALLGFLFGEASHLLRQRYRIRRLKHLIREELKAIAAQMEQKKDIIRKIIKNLDEKNILDGRSVHMLSIGYKNHISDLYEHLTVKQRNCLHVIYERIVVMDDFMDSIKKEFVFDQKQNIYNDLYGGYKVILQDFLQSCSVVDGLIQSYLNNDPTDVFYVEDCKEKG